MIRNTPFLLFLAVGMIALTQVHAQSKSDRDMITYCPEKTQGRQNEKGALSINVSPADVAKFKADGWVRYSDFGAVGDGITDDTDAIFAAHTFANQHNLKVKSDEGASYYIGGRERTTDIRTDTDFGIDETKLTITGGTFTTVANRDASKYTYYNRGIAINRSNVLVEGLEHLVTGEGDHGAPYSGFISISNCSNVTIRNTTLTGHKTYQTIGSAGVAVSMGTYDISVNRALNVTFEHCSQTNDINDRTYWGIMGSNYSKNLVYDDCTFSRFDAHMGVANATIRNSTLGHQGINAIGSGTFTVENSTIRSRNLINLRSDYGSTWQGEIIIRHCKFVPSGVRTGGGSLIGGSNSGQHDFGYTCYMPERITIENLHIDDAGYPENYRGITLFANFNPQMKDESYVEKFPYVRTKEVVLKDITTVSGNPLIISDNPYMFRDVRIFR